MPVPLRAYLVDDEPLALERLSRLLRAHPEVAIAGSATDPAAALESLSHESVDVVFLDIQMPGLNGFELLSRLPEQPMVIFTTAYDQYALKAFEVNSIDYLLKPVEPEQLGRALQKLERLRGGLKPAWMQHPDLKSLLTELAASLRQPQPDYPQRVAWRVGEKVSFIDLHAVTHFFARDKLTYAAAAGRNHCIDETITELEQKLDPRKFVRIHRAILLNLDWVQEVNSWFGGRVIVSLKDPHHTRLTVARDRVRALRSRLGF
jgi:two-component system LytT family response regulator